MTARKSKTADTSQADPVPHTGGAFVRQADGTLVRDRDTEQAIPDGEDTGAPIAFAAPEIAPPAGSADSSQEG